jgi:hypothetical protein
VRGRSANDGDQRALPGSGTIGRALAGAPARALTGHKVVGAHASELIKRPGISSQHHARKFASALTLTSVSSRGRNFINYDKLHAMNAS